MMLEILADSNIYFSDQVDILYNKISYYKDYFKNFTILYNPDDKGVVEVFISSDSGYDTKRPYITVYGVNDIDKLQIESNLKQEYGDKIVRSL